MSVYAMVALRLVLSAAVVFGCAVYFFRRRSGLSVVLLAGAVAQSVVGLVGFAPLLPAFDRMGPPAFSRLMTVVNPVGLLVSAVFTVSLVMVLMEKPAVSA